MTPFTILVIVFLVLVIAIALLIWRLGRIDANLNRLNAEGVQPAVAALERNSLAIEEAVAGLQQTLEEVRRRPPIR